VTELRAQETAEIGTQLARIGDVTEPRRTIVVVDASRDTFELLETYFGALGFGVRWCAVSEPPAAEKLADGVVEHDPDVVIYDIDLPYAASWRSALTICFDARVKCPFVFTTTNVRVAKQLMAEVTRAAVIQKPYSLEALHALVIEAIGSYMRPTPTAAPAVERRHADRRRGDRRRS
jgi:DNA-binding response OmpR family regulator